MSQTTVFLLHCTICKTHQKCIKSTITISNCYNKYTQVSRKLTLTENMQCISLNHSKCTFKLLKQFKIEKFIMVYIFDAPNVLVSFSFFFLLLVVKFSTVFLLHKKICIFVKFSSFKLVSKI